LYVVINGIPSNGTYVIVGSGNIEKQTVLNIAALPTSVNSTKSVQGNGNGNANGNTSSDSGSSGPSKGVVIAAVVGGIAVLGIAGAIIGICMSRRKSAKGFAAPDAQGAAYGNKAVNNYAGAPNPAYMDPASRYGERPSTGSEASFLPLKQGNESGVWSPRQPAAMESSASFGGPEMTPYRDYDPYNAQYRDPQRVASPRMR